MREKDEQVTTLTCGLADRDRRIAGYLAETLPADQAEAFEAHYFGCDECWCEVRQGLEIRGAMPAEPESSVASPAGAVPPRRRSGQWYWLAAAASVVLAVSVWQLTGHRGAPGEPPATFPTTQPSPSPSAAPGVAAVTPAPTLSPGATAPGRPTSPPTAPAVPVGVLARVDPPIYLPVTLRGARDEAAERFEAAMRRYVDKDFAGAIPDLETAVRLHPDAPHANFFLAICQLLTGKVAPAVEGLQNTIALGESPYLEEAHFYLAKARLRQNNLGAARDELTRTVERRGRLESDARQLLAQVDRLLTGKSGRQ